MRILPLDTTIKEIDIYVIVSRISKDVFVWKTKSSNCYKAYKEHAAGRYARTKTLFVNSEIQGLFPYMYLLETLQTTDEVAFRHCIAWTKYFTNHGYISCSYKTVDRYSEDMNEDTLSIYDSIKNLPLEKVLNIDQIVVQKYKRQQKRKGSDKSEITIALESEDYERIQRCAKELNLNVMDYCKHMVLNGCIRPIVPPPILEHTEEVREAKIILKQILYAYYRNGRYYPADLEGIQKMIDKITDAEKKVSKAFRKYANASISEMQNKNSMTAKDGDQ